MNKFIKKITHIIPDKVYLKLIFRKKMNKKLNLKNPKTFNEKLQWLKLYDRRPEYTKMVDKYEVKKYVADVIGKEYIIPTLGIYNKFEDIDFNKLPKQFVIKCTHDSGGIVICKDKDKLNITEAKQKINNSLKENYYYYGREWPYKNVKPRILIEQYMEDKNNKRVDNNFGEEVYDLPDYKYFVFNGKCRLMFVATGRQSKTETCFDFYDEKFNHLPFTNGHPNSDDKINKPKNFEKMIALSEEIAKKINCSQVRVDFYEINDKVYFGEITFCHWSGLVPFVPEEWDYNLGEYINLNKKNGE